MDSMQNLFVFLRKLDRFCVVTVVSFRAVTGSGFNQPANLGHVPPCRLGEKTSAKYSTCYLS